MNGKKKFYGLLIGFQFVLLLVVLLTVGGLSSFVSAQAQQVTATVDSVAIAGLAIGSALAVGISALGAGFAVKTTGTAAISTLAEREEAFFKAFLVVALGEALAIYGLIVSILLWIKIPI